ncbi:MAG: hypothetical protein GYA33_05795 [Thermogutta sp.]|nr:hypothetical protein [Thermogutta sp.]
MGLGIGPAVAAEEVVLPVGGNPAALNFPHFPDAAHAVIWRNWGLVSADDLAGVLGASGDEVRTAAAAMGLPPCDATSDLFRRRGYITLIRRNWHLLPYDQLLELLDMTPQELAYVLREDDFLFVKLGNLKPDCDRVRLVPPTAEVQQAEARIRAILAEHLGETAKVEGEPRFAFVEELSRPERPITEASPERIRQGLRLIYSYFAPYGDPLMHPELDPYPDGLLQRLADLGVNGVWMHVVLRNLAPGGDDFPEFGKGCETRLRNLQALASRAKRHGIGIYLYINEPRAMPHAFFADRPEMAGVKEGEFTAMCTSNPRVQAWLRNSLTHVFREVPDLAGVFTITASENLTNCASHFRRQDCPRCAARTDDEILAEVNRLIEEGVHAGNPEARVIVWDWGWHGHQDASSLIPLLPKSVWLMSVSEWSQPFERGGIRGTVGEYCMSVPGPGPRAVRHWAEARRHGLKTAAKVQFNVTWELSTVPFLPVLDLVAEHCANLNRQDIDGIMLTWTLGGYPSPNLAVASRFAANKEATAEEVLDAVAAERYGSKPAPQVRRAWAAFSRAFQEYPYSGQVVYNGPQHMGPANLLWLQPSGYRATMTGLPYDDLNGWRGPYPEAVFASQWDKLVEGWQRGLDEFRAAEALADQDKRPVLESDLRVAEAAFLHFASVRNQVRFVMLRNAWLGADPDSPAGRDLQSKLLAVVEDELVLAKRLFTLASADSRLGFEASNHYFYVPGDLLEKIVNCEDILSRLGAP